MKLLDSFNQWFSTGENFEDLPQGPFDMSGDIVGCHKGEAVVVAVGIEWIEDKMLLTILECTGQPLTTKSYPAQNVTTEFEKTCLQVCTCAKLIKNIST